MKNLKYSYNLAGAEQEVMETLWASEEMLSTSELLEKMNGQGKNWKRQTLNTILARLEEKGCVCRPRAFVKASISKKDLLQLQTREILDNFYEGKLKNFCAALIGDARLDENDVESLNAMIDELQKKKDS